MGHIYTKAFMADMLFYTIDQKSRERIFTERKGNMNQTCREEEKWKTEEYGWHSSFWFHYFPEAQLNDSPWGLWDSFYSYRSFPSCVEVGLKFRYVLPKSNKKKKKKQWETKSNKFSQLVDSAWEESWVENGKNTLTYRCLFEQGLTQWLRWWNTKPQRHKKAFQRLPR